MATKRQTEAGIIMAASEGCVGGYFPDLPAIGNRKLQALLKAHRLDRVRFTEAAQACFEVWPGPDLVHGLHETFAGLVSGAISHNEGLDPDLVAEFPAQRLIVEVAERWDVPAWPEVWAVQGGRLIHGSMVALKADPIWAKVSAFGLPFPPFLPGSGMGVEDVDRDEAAELGLCALRGPVPMPAAGHISPIELAAKLRYALGAIREAKQIKKTP